MRCCQSWPLTLPLLVLPSCSAGISELNWDAIAKHLGRGKRSVQRKYDNLKGSLVHGPPGGALGQGGTATGVGLEAVHCTPAAVAVLAYLHTCMLSGMTPALHLTPPSNTCTGAAPLPSNDGKKWSQEEVQELLQLVEDEHYRRQRLGLEKVRSNAWLGWVRKSSLRWQRRQRPCSTVALPASAAHPPTHIAAGCSTRSPCSVLLLGSVWAGSCQALRAPSCPQLISCCRPPSNLPSTPPGRLACLWAALWALIRVGLLQVLLHQEHGAHRCACCALLAQLACGGAHAWGPGRAPLYCLHAVQ